MQKQYATPETASYHVLLSATHSHKTTYQQILRVLEANAPSWNSPKQSPQVLVALASSQRCDNRTPPSGTGRSSLLLKLKHRDGHVQSLGDENHTIMVTNHHGSLCKGTQEQYHGETAVLLHSTSHNCCQQHHQPIMLSNPQTPPMQATQTSQGTEQLLLSGCVWLSFICPPYW